MYSYKKHLCYKTSGQGCYEITDYLSEGLCESKFSDGIVSVFVRHTSCSLVLMENADPSARFDLERYLCKLVPENDLILPIPTKDLTICHHILKWHSREQVKTFPSLRGVYCLVIGKAFFFGSIGLHLIIEI